MFCVLCWDILKMCYSKCSLFQFQIFRREIFVHWWIFEPVLFFPRHVQLLWKIHLSPMRKNSFVEMIFFSLKPWPDTSHVYLGNRLLTDTTHSPVSSFGATKRRRYILPVLHARMHAKFDTNTSQISICASAITSKKNPTKQRKRSRLPLLPRVLSIF